MEIRRERRGRLPSGTAYALSAPVMPAGAEGSAPESAACETRRSSWPSPFPKNSLKKDSSFAPRRKSETLLTGLCLVNNILGGQSEPSRRPNAACYAPPRAISASPQLRTLFAIDQWMYHNPYPIRPAARANHQNPGGSTRASRITSPSIMATSPQRQRRPLRIKTPPAL